MLFALCVKNDLYNKLHLCENENMITSFFITEEQTELHVVRDISGITKRQDVSVGIRYATVLSNISHYKSIAYIYLHLFPIHFQVFFICLISACVKGFTGHNCNVICPFPAYGLDCQSICNCTEKSCDPGDGCIGQPKMV